MVILVLRALSQKRQRWAKSFFGDVKMANAVLATTLGTDNTYGTVAGRTPAGPFSYARIAGRVFAISNASSFETFVSDLIALIS
jgi:hypothetical protein